MEESLKAEVRTVQGRGVWHSLLNMSSRGPATHFLIFIFKLLKTANQSRIPRQWLFT
ncbi:rCG42011 [Rattus norvegicus]|uniref:RCG42011 n=1 Tax=Rattus norvegicus TaxID=10116 RepID=A6JUV1_RAT|nr:rCG42011 [Rattus norvegicus]